MFALVLFLLFLPTLTVLAYGVFCQSEPREPMPVEVIYATMPLYMIESDLFHSSSNVKG